MGPRGWGQKEKGWTARAAQWIPSDGDRSMEFREFYWPEQWLQVTVIKRVFPQAIREECCKHKK